MAGDINKRISDGLVVEADGEADNDSDDSEDDKEEEEANPALAPRSTGMLDSLLCLFQTETSGETRTCRGAQRSDLPSCCIVLYSLCNCLDVVDSLVLLTNQHTHLREVRFR